jgi:hypothetical protein
MMAEWTRRVGIFAVLACVVAGLSAVIFWRQLSVMQGQLNMMEADQRRWLVVEIAPGSDLEWNICAMQQGAIHVV